MVVGTGGLEIPSADQCKQDPVMVSQDASWPLYNPHLFIYELPRYSFCVYVFVHRFHIEKLRVL